MHLGGELQAQGGSLEKVARHFPPERYELFALDPQTEESAEGMVPVPFAEAGFTDRRFFLIARARPKHV